MDNTTNTQAKTAANAANQKDGKLLGAIQPKAIPFSALGLLPTPDAADVQIGNATITVKRHLPFEQLVDMMQWAIDYIIGDRPYMSDPLYRIVCDFAVLKFYTNFDLSFMKAETPISTIYENYDFIFTYKVMDAVRNVIDADQLSFYDESLQKTITAIQAYRNSAKGIVDVLSDGAKTTTADMDKAMEFLGDDEQNKKISQLLQLVQSMETPDNK